jgi:RNA polymerase sigma factor (sigma-70 family)
MSNSQSASASGIRGCSEDIEKAFWQLWQQNQDYLYRCCLKWMSGNLADAEEALSRAMLKAWDKLPNHAEKITNFRAWLTRLTHNLCIDIHRERRRKAMQMESIEEIAARDNSAVISCLDSPELALLHHELGQYIRRAINTLPSRLRTPFVLHYYREISYQDIAQALAISIDNVYKRIQQARDILQKRLSRYFSGLDDALFDSYEHSYKREKSVVESEQFYPPRACFQTSLSDLDPPKSPLKRGTLIGFSPLDKGGWGGSNGLKTDPNLSYQRGNRDWKLASPNNKSFSLYSPLTKGGLRGVKARCEQSDETMISDSQAAIATGCMNETIHYHVTASCLETLHSGWYRSLCPLGWN